MPIVRHVIIALGYTVIAAAVALTLPRFLPTIDVATGILFGTIVLVGFALFHETFARQEECGRLSEEIRDLRRSQGEVMRELSEARGEVGRIHEALVTARGSSRSKEMQKEFDKMMAEVEILQGLVGQLSGETQGKAQTDHFDSDFEEPTVEEHATPLKAGEDRARKLAPVASGLNDEMILEIIREGLKRDRVDLVLQPIVSLPQRKKKFFEAFTRIRAEDGSIIVPEQYIGIAEREGLITAIDNMLLFRCVQLLRGRQVRNRNIGFFCNISPYTLADHAFFQDFVEFMSENSELAPNLIFELAQATISNRDEQIERQLARLGSIGFRFSMDQVASLSLDYPALARQSFKFVKIDAQVLLNEYNAEAPELDVHVADLKRALDRHGIDLIVEKIESEPMLLELLDFHIDFGQGYLFGEPRTSRTA